MKDFKDKVIWITGASSGIGEALANQCAAMGGRLILSSNEPEELERVAGDCASAGERPLVLPLDLTDPAGITAAADEVLGKFGHVDLLVNNGGISQRSLVKDTTMETYRKIMEIDFFGHVGVTKAVLPSMLERKSGHIVVTTSVSGKYGVPIRSGYCAAKHALHGFFDSLRAEVWRDNIKVTIVAPTGVKTKISLNAVVGDGSKYGKMDDLMTEGISAEECARQIITAVQKEKEEIVVGWDKAKIAAYLKRFTPGLFSKIIRSAKVT